MAEDDVDNFDRGPGTAGLPQAVDALALVPGIGQALQYLISYIPAVAEERVRQTLQGVLDLLERDPDWLERQLRTHSGAVHLLTRLARGLAEDTEDAFEHKLQIYKAIVRRGIVDDAEVDTEMIRLAAVSEMTALDLRVLLSAQRLMTEARRPHISGADLMERNQLTIGTAQAAIGHLERLTILQASGLTYAELEGSDSGLASRLVVTEFGNELLQMLGEDTPDLEQEAAD